MDETESFVDETRQFISLVADFSSHYSEDGGYSYSVLNLLGKPRQFPQYGESSTTFSTRHHKYTACHVTNFKRKSLSTDFIDVAFDEPVFPKKINIYQTCTVGYITRIFVNNSDNSWSMVYEATKFEDTGQAEKLTVDVTSRQKTKMLRIELCTTLAPHFIGLDAVELIGELELSPTPPPLPLHLQPSVQKIVGQIPNIDVQYELTKHMKELKEYKRSENVHSLLLSLPRELCLKILENLDLIDLCRVRLVCKSLTDIASDPSLFVNVSLRCCWHLVSPGFLENLTPLLGSSKRLDLSWCGPYRRICPKRFISFVRSSGLRLTHLHLDNCHFITNDSLYWVASTCKLLEELSLQSCRNVESDGFFHLAMLDRLKKLWLGRTKIQWLGLGAILESSPDLTHLSLGSCDLHASTDFIAGTVKRLVPNIQVLDLWRVGKLSAGGIEALSCLTLLEELEIGWCSNSSSPSSIHICRLVSRCRKLRKIGLAGLRVVCDTDLIAVAESCADLQFLDVTGNGDVTATGCERILGNCRSLKCIDLSYCPNISLENLETWRMEYPRVSIKVAPN